MNILYAPNLKSLTTKLNNSYALAIVQRTPPHEANAFFQQLTKQPINIAGKVSKKATYADITKLMAVTVSLKLKQMPFYKVWLNDMSNICKAFCILQNSSDISFSLTSQRGCKRYHVDYVPQRLLVTYFGQGTEWIPEESANRKAFMNGESNDKIIKDKSKLQFMNEWDIGLFKGGEEGIIHRTPDSALNTPSLLMKLDEDSFWNNLLSAQQ